MAKKRGLLSRFIRGSYKALSTLNTLNTLASGNPVKISRHLARKRTVKWGGSIIPKTK